MIEWQYYPKSMQIPIHLLDIIETVFKKNINEINSGDFELKSNDVLKVLRADLISLNYRVEKGKTFDKKIEVPVLFGKNGKMDKHFDADAYSSKYKTVIEIETGRGYVNNQFLKDLFQACVMVNVDYLVIGIRNVYKRHNDFGSVNSFIDALFSSDKFKLPLTGVLIIGY